MKKVAIITFHKAHNYGAVLQAFALKHFLKSRSFNVDFIDSAPSFLAKNKLFNPVMGKGFIVFTKSLFLSLLLFYPSLIRRRRFNKFISLFLNSELPVSNTEEFGISLDYKAVVIGSDQVWNVRLSKGFYPIYFGVFKRNKDTTKLISYAASFANFNITAIEKKLIGSALLEFDAISVREYQGRDYIKDSYGIESRVVLDPVFLLSKNDWLKALPKPKNLPKFKYLLVYSIGHEFECNKLADIVSDTYNLQKLSLNAYLDKRVFSNKYQLASPIDFVHLFANADFIVTSSFHGTAFSLIFNRDFYSIAHNNEKDSRQITLLTKLNLLNRLIPYDHNFDAIEINKIKMTHELTKFIFDSKEFLLKSVEDE